MLVHQRIKHAEIVHSQLTEECHIGFSLSILLKELKVRSRYT